MGEKSQKLFHLPGSIEEETEGDNERSTHKGGSPRAESPLLGQRSGITIVPSFPKNVTLMRVSTHSSSIGAIGRQDSTRSRYRAGPIRKLRRRAVLKNGECNVLQSRISRRSLRFLQDIFTTLVDTQWRWTLLCFTLSFLLSWLGFAVIWWLIAFTHGDFEEGHLPDFQGANNWTPCVTSIYTFTSCFLFSIETQHTIGYGGRSTTEECPEAIFVMCLQSISGVMIQAFMVGIVFAKMSRPKQRTQTLLFSRNAVICQRDGELCLMFRVGDMRKSHIIGATVRAQVIRSRTTKEGETLPHNQQELAVGTDGQNENLFFIWPMTVVHKINEESPFYHMSAEDMLTERFEVVVILEGTIESTGQTTQARSSYVPQEMLWGHRFEPMVSYSKERQGYEVDYSLFNSTVQVDTPLCSGKELAEFYRVQDELRHGIGGFLVDEDLIPESFPGLQRLQSHHPYQHHYCHHPHHESRIGRADSTRSVVSVEEITHTDKCTRNGHSHNPYSSEKETNNQHQVIEIDPDAIQVIGDAELEHLPEAVNQEIVKNSKEITYEYDSRICNHKDDNLSSQFTRQLSAPQKRVGALKHMFLEDGRRSLNGSRRNLYCSRSAIPAWIEDDRRSLNGSRRNLNINGSRKYLYLTLERSESHCHLDKTEGRENEYKTRRHTGSKERLNSMKIADVTPKKVLDLKIRNNVLKTMAKENEKKANIQNNNLQEVVVHRIDSKNRTSVSPNSDCTDLSPESGFAESNITEIPLKRNRRSYECAQMQDVNRALSTSIDCHSSSGSEVTSSVQPEGCGISRNTAVVNLHEEHQLPRQTSFSYTSV